MGGGGGLQLFNLFLKLICRFSEDGSPGPSEEVRWEQLQILESLLKLYPDLIKIHRQTVLGNFNMSSSNTGSLNTLHSNRVFVSRRDP
jgi:hypothetical protein